MGHQDHLYWPLRSRPIRVRVSVRVRIRVRVRGFPYIRLRVRVGLRVRVRVCNLLHYKDEPQKYIDIDDKP